MVPGKGLRRSVIAKSFGFGWCERPLIVARTEIDRQMDRDTWTGMTGEVQCPEQVRNIEWRLNRLKVHPRREKAKTKVKMIFDVQNFFFDLFRWFFDFLAFAFAFALCDWPLLSFSLRGTRHITGSSPTKSSTCASTGIEMDQPPCWLPRGQQVSHQRWIWGIYCTQVMKHASERIYPGKSRRHQKSKQGYQWPHKKRLMSSKQCCCFF